MNRHLRNRLQYHRQLGNTLSAFSITAIMLGAVLMTATPVQPSGAHPAQAGTANTAIDAARNPVKSFDANAVQAQAHDIEARAEQLAAQLEKTRNASQAIAHVVAFTAEVATVAAITAALDEIPESVETAELAAPTPATSTRKHKRTRQSLAMPYFSFASRS
ncbi:MAG: hypothetical protein M3R16_04920 [Pseudomonadota bacterium]|nr:hypothetical protein [Pseudomonadota bacterium]